MRNLHGMDKLFIGISKLWGISASPGMVKRGIAMKDVSSIENAWIWVSNGTIEKFGSMSDLQSSSNKQILSLLPKEDQWLWNLNTIQPVCGNPSQISPLDLDVRFELPLDFPGANFESLVFMRGMELMPGFVDSHTHIVFAEPRTEEFKLRIQGADYEEIAAAGGGILNSAKKLQQMDFDTLLTSARSRLQAMVEHGTTTVEIKSGYGLTLDSELKMLRVIAQLKSEFPGIIKSTFLGAHAFPSDYKGSEDSYVELIIDTMLPEIAKEGLADHMDVFCDRGFFSPAQTDKLLKAAKKYGLPAKIHANELGITGGVQVGVSNQAWSVDHLEYMGDEEIQILKECLLSDQGETVAVALPGCSYFLGIPFSDVRAMIDSGLVVALATDFNPGSSPVCSLQMVWSLACTKQKLFPAEAFHAITCNAARALRLEDQVGSIAVGMHANFILTAVRNAVDTVPYFFGQNHINSVYIRGNRWSKSTMQP